MLRNYKIFQDFYNVFLHLPGQGLTFGKLKDGAGVAKNQLLHRLFDTPSPWNSNFCKSLIISNNVPRTCVQRISETFAVKVVQNAIAGMVLR